MQNMHHFRTLQQALLHHFPGGRRLSDANEDYAGIGRAFVKDGYPARLREGEILRREHVPRIFAVEKAPDVILPQISATGVKDGILYHGSSAGRAVASDDGEDGRSAAPRKRDDPLQLRKRIVNTCATRMKIILLYILPPSHAGIIPNFRS